ncbi:MAG: Hsp20/alpha crystallin family protein [Rhodocyclaceae bacterium]|jgi:HSP20 family protein|nr:MAG: Hsp20/alpha crystallin family protein [Rhodocyclaceae bacterium]
MKLESLKENVGAWWDNLAEGWRHLRDSAASALTSFKPGDQTNLPGEAEIDAGARLPGRGWGMIGGDVFEDETRVVVRLEVPGMAKEDIDIEVREDALVISGEKRFERESSEGRWRVMQCAYGSFRRVVPLPVAIRAEEARATYRNGVLRVEMPKANRGKPRGVNIRVD